MKGANIVGALKEIVSRAEDPILKDTVLLARPIGNEPDRWAVEIWCRELDLGLLVADENLQVAVPTAIWHRVRELEPFEEMGNLQSVRVMGYRAKNLYSLGWLRMFLKNGRTLQEVGVWESFGVSESVAVLFHANGADRLKKSKERRRKKPSP